MGRQGLPMTSLASGLKTIYSHLWLGREQFASTQSPLAVSGIGSLDTMS